VQERGADLPPLPSSLMFLLKKNTNVSGGVRYLPEIIKILYLRKKVMKRAVIIYHSNTGITRMYADEMEAYLKNKGLEVTSLSIWQYKDGLADGADYLLLGCWTSGIMIAFQHPEKVWREFAAKFKTTGNPKVILFTTYKILTGSMFRNMLKHLQGKIHQPFAELKSRTGNLSLRDKEILDSFIGD
jgi:flavodoxin